MARVFAKRAYDMTKYNFFGLETATNLVPHLDTPFKVNGTTYPDQIEAKYINGSGSLFFASPNIPQDDTFLSARVNGLLHSSNSTAGGVWAGIQGGGSFTLQQLDAAWSTSGTVDDQALLSKMLAGADSFRLSAGADVAKGFGGNDTMNGNGGADRLYGGMGGDTVSGGMGNDSLWGDAGADTLNAGTGRDYLMGGNGKDTLVGGTDAAGDVFKFNDWLDSTFGAVDRIVNFTRGADDIDMRNVDADENSESTNEAFHFSNRTADAHAIWWKPMQGGVLVQADVSGDGLAEMEIFVRGVQALTASDFLL